MEKGRESNGTSALERSAYFPRLALDSEFLSFLLRAVCVLAAALETATGLPLSCRRFPGLPCPYGIALLRRTRKVHVILYSRFAWLTLHDHRPQLCARRGLAVGFGADRRADSASRS